MVENLTIGVLVQSFDILFEKEEQGWRFTRLERNKVGEERGRRGTRSKMNEVEDERGRR